MRTFYCLGTIVFFSLSISSYSCPLPPTADIDLYLANPLHVGETAYFLGFGVCPEGGTIIAYEWVFPSEAYYINGNGTDTSICKFYPASPENEEYEVKLRVKSSTGLWSDYATQIVDVDAAEGPWYVSVNGNDDYNGQYSTYQSDDEGPFQTIQTAIDSAAEDDEIIVAEGIYRECINLKGKKVTIRSTNPDDWSVVENTIINGHGQGAVVFFEGSETPACHLKGITVMGGGTSFEDPLDDYLEGHWELNEINGTETTDSSENGNVGTLLPTGSEPTLDSNGGRIGGCFVFIGTNYVQMNNYYANEITGSQARTTCAWIKMSSGGTGGTILSYGGSAYRGSWLFMVNENNKLQLGVNGGNIIGDPVLVANRWYHVAAVLDDWTGDGLKVNDLRLYIDGKQVTGPYINPNEALTTGNTYPVRIGTHISVSYFFNGRIDDVRLYSKALTESEIQSLAGDPGKAAHWKLDDDYEDVSGNNLDGTAHNSPSWTEGIIDNAVSLNGTTQYVSISNSPVLNPKYITLSAWINIPATEIHGGIVCKDNSSTSQRTWQFRVLSGKVVFIPFIADGNYKVCTGTTTVSDETWHHVVGTWDGSTVCVYVDGKLDKSEPYVGTLQQGQTNDVTIGLLETNAEFLGGLIDDIRIYNRALNDAEIHSLYTRGGGIWGNGTQATISNCIIRNNESDEDGGGIRDVDGNITNCFILSNESQANGGGLADCDGLVANCVIKNNGAPNSNGGALNNCDGDILNCTIVNNTAAVSVGGIRDSDGTVTNTILWNNEDSGSGTNVQDAQIKDCIATVINSCIQDGTIDDSHYEGEGNMDDDPLFKADGCHLSKDSPCINKALYDKRVPLFDIDGQDRFMGALLDVGADEVPNILYVNKSSPGQIQDGSSWGRAFANLQDALSEAGSNGQIWVAGGVYTPDTGGGQTLLDRNASFELPEDVEVYGGFNGTEESASQRNWIENPTILGGDLQQDDGTVGKIDNSYHVVKGADNAVLDGFRISGGNANGTGNDAKGGGILNLSASPILRNCIIIANHASDKGGGIYNENCTLSVLLGSCNVIYNSAVNEGGGMYNNNAKAILTNCIVWGNTAGTGISVVNAGTSQTVVSYCDIQGCGGSGGGSWNQDIGTDGGNNIDQDPMFVSYKGADDIPGTEDDDYSLNSGSPCLVVGVGEQHIGVLPREDVRIIDEGTGTDPVDIFIHEDLIYVLSSNDHAISVFNDQLVLQTAYFTGGILTVDAVTPRGICLDEEDRIYIADTGNHRILRYTSQGVLDTDFDEDGIAGQAGTSDGELNAPWGIGLNWDGNVYVSDSGNNRVQVFDSSGQFVKKWGQQGTEPEQYNSPCGFSIYDSDVTTLLIADKNNHRMQWVEGTLGESIDEFGTSGTDNGQFASPSDVWYDSYNEHIFVADAGNNRIQVLGVFSEGIGFLKEIAPPGLSNPSGVACINQDGIQELFIADTGNHRVVKVSIEYELPTNHPIYVWEQFKNALRADDIDSALSFMTEKSQNNYEVILQALQPYFGQVVNGMGQMEFEYRTDTTALYEMLHDKGSGVISAFPVYFIRDMDGNWRIDCF